MPSTLARVAWLPGTSGVSVAWLLGSFSSPKGKGRLPPHGCALRGSEAVTSDSLRVHIGSSAQSLHRGTNFWPSSVGSCVADFGRGPRIPAPGAQHLPVLPRGPRADKLPGLQVRLHRSRLCRLSLALGALEGLHASVADLVVANGAGPPARACRGRRRGGLPVASGGGSPCSQPRGAQGPEQPPRALRRSAGSLQRLFPVACGVPWPRSRPWSVFPLHQSWTGAPPPRSFRVLHLLWPWHPSPPRRPQALQFLPNSGSGLRSPSSASHSSTPRTQGRPGPCPAPRPHSFALSAPASGHCSVPCPEGGAYGWGPHRARNLGSRVLPGSCFCQPGEAHSRFFQRFWHW